MSSRKECRIISFITDDNRRFAITHFDPDPTFNCWPPLEGPNAGPVYRWQVTIGKSHLTWELNQAQFTEQRNTIELHGFRVYIVERRPLEEA